ncbi:hypothetical protein A2U01_0055844, partial [Trifolium medium]|nr:hypothetical protein [Trifolium medium]
GLECPIGLAIEVRILQFPHLPPVLLPYLLFLALWLSPEPGGGVSR